MAHSRLVLSCRRAVLAAGGQSKSGGALVSFGAQPGLCGLATGDANAVRNEIAQKEFKRADFVCVCARVDRAITDKASLQWLDKSLRDMPSAMMSVPMRSDVTTAAWVQQQDAAEKHPVSSRDYARCVGLEEGVPAAFLKRPRRFPKCGSTSWTS